MFFTRPLLLMTFIFLNDSSSVHSSFYSGEADDYEYTTDFSPEQKKQLAQEVEEEIGIPQDRLSLTEILDSLALVKILAYTDEDIFPDVFQVGIELCNNYPPIEYSQILHLSMGCLHENDQGRKIIEVRTGTYCSLKKQAKTYSLIFDCFHAEKVGCSCFRMGEFSIRRKELPIIVMPAIQDCVGIVFLNKVKNIIGSFHYASSKLIDIDKRSECWNCFINTLGSDFKDGLDIYLISSRINNLSSVYTLLEDYGLLRFLKFVDISVIYHRRNSSISIEGHNPIIEECFYFTEDEKIIFDINHYNEDFNRKVDYGLRPEINGSIHGKTVMFDTVDFTLSSIVLSQGKVKNKV